MANPKSTKKIPKEEPVDTKDIDGEEAVVPEEFNLEELMNNPIVQDLLGGAKDLFKKEKEDPNVCEIYIKGPSEAVLKLFKIAD